jgi:hypothetical protein
MEKYGKARGDVAGGMRPTDSIQVSVLSAAIAGLSEASQWRRHMLISSASKILPGTEMAWRGSSAIAPAFSYRVGRGEDS